MKVYRDKVNFTEAEDRCVEDNAHLVKITTAEKNEAVWDLLRNASLESPNSPTAYYCR